jgi:hypothetical protein
MTDGPVEYLVIGFEGNQFTGAIGPALRDLVDRGIIRVIDIVFAKKDRDGNVTVLELQKLSPEEAALFHPAVDEVGCLFSQDDIAEVSALLEPNCSAALVLFEHTWAAALRQAVVDANGRLLTGGLIPRELVEQVRSRRNRAAA